MEKSVQKDWRSEKEVEVVAFTLKMRSDTSSGNNLKKNCRNGNIRLLRQ